MRSWRRVSAVEQVRNHLRAELCRRTWPGRLPGVHALAAELGANHKTVAAALRLLEQERLLVPQGAGRARRVRAPRGRQGHRPLRVAILNLEPPAWAAGCMAELTHRLRAAGHIALVTASRRAAGPWSAPRERDASADAWVVGAGAREVLEWFSARGFPACALCGPRPGLPLAAAGPDKAAAYAAAARRLIELGHRRIVLLARPPERRPEPGAAARAFLGALAAHGIPTGPYNLPDWDEGPAGFHAGLDQLFRHTRPTALLMDEAPLFIAAQQFCGNRGLRVPEDVSLVCADDSPAFAWCQPTVARFHWDSRPVVRRVLRWADQVARGRPDTRQRFAPAKFIPGGTIGPARPGPAAP